MSRRVSFGLLVVFCECWDVGETIWPIPRHGSSYKPSNWEKVRLRGLEVAMYGNEKGFELIAKALGIVYPSRL